MSEAELLRHALHVGRIITPPENRPDLAGRVATLCGAVGMLAGPSAPATCAPCLAVAAWMDVWPALARGHRRGRQYNAPCPACGGTDRFRLMPTGRAICRRCGPVSIESARAAVKAKATEAGP